MRIFTASLLLCILSGCALIPPENGTVLADLRPFLPHQYAHEVTQNEFEDETKIGGVDAPVYYSCPQERPAAAAGGAGSRPGSTSVHQYDGDATVAAIATPFAMMASNSYKTNAYFVIPGWTPVMHWRGGFGAHVEVGFQADVYEEAAPPKRIAIVFRGTDTRTDDVANFSIAVPGSNSRVPAQYQLADRLTKIVKGMPRYTQSRFVFVGHSLGGALAIHAGWSIPESEAFAFNSSPRTWTEGESATGSVRYDISESGEILRLLAFWKDLRAKTYSFDFGSAGKIEDHSMYRLARGLLYLARKQGDPMAKEADFVNLGCPL